MFRVMLCLLISNALEGEGEVLTALYVPYDGNITDCYLQELMHVSEVQCAFRAWSERIIALVYDDSTKICYHCLPPHKAVNQPRRTVPTGYPVVMKVEYHHAMQF